MKLRGGGVAGWGGDRYMYLNSKRRREEEKKRGGGKKGGE